MRLYVGMRDVTVKLFFVLFFWPDPDLSTLILSICWYRVYHWTHWLWHTLFSSSYLIQILNVLVQKCDIYKLKLLLWYEWKGNWEIVTPETDVIRSPREKTSHSVGVMAATKTLKPLTVVHWCYRVEAFLRKRSLYRHWLAQSTLTWQRTSFSLACYQVTLRININ